MWRKATILQFYGGAFRPSAFFSIIALQLPVMALKNIGYYNEAAQANPSDADKLYLEIGRDELACLVKGGVSTEIEAFELFRLQHTVSQWEDVFYEVKKESHLLNRHYKEVHCYFRTEESVIIPSGSYSISAAEDYLNLLYGESTRHDHKHDTLNTNPGMVNAYRITKIWNDLMGSNFILYKPHHTYSALLNNILAEKDQADHFIKLQVYQSQLIIAVIKNRQLQLVQSYTHIAPEDILYHLVHISQTMELDVAHSHLEISGLFEPGSVLHQQLQPLFGLISFDGIEPDGVFTSAGEFPLHYFTPYYKLVV